MVTVDLITGFLGSGKTTFIRKYAEYLLKKGENICILENDFGAVNVDMMLLQELYSERCELEMVAGDKDLETHRRRFKTKLISLGMQGFDRVIVEPSGIFEPDEFFDLLYEDPLDRWYQVGNVIAIVDAGLSGGLSKDSEYIIASQTADAGILVLSKTGDADADPMRAVSYVNQALKNIGADRQWTDQVLAKDWNSFTEDDFSRIASSGFVHTAFGRRPVMQKNQYESLYFMNLSVSREYFNQLCESIFQDRKCGRIYRIKGFLKEGENWLSANATESTIRICQVQQGQDILIVIGEELNKTEIQKYFK